MKKLLDLAKTSLIIALTISMLTTAGLYINARQNEQTGNPIPWEKLKILEAGGQSPLSYAAGKNHCLPLQITVTNGEKSVTSIYNEKLTETIYNDFGDIFRAIFDVSSLSGENFTDSQKEAMFESALGSADSVYVRYAADYPYPLIYNSITDNKNSAAAEKDETGQGQTTDTKPMSSVKEFVAVVNKNSTQKEFYAVCRDSAGNISVFYPDSEKAAVFAFVDKVNFNAYNDIAGIIPCKIKKNSPMKEEQGFNRNNIDKLLLPDTYHFLYDYTYSAEITNSPWFTGNGRSIDHSDENIKRLLRIFNINTENSNHYSASQNNNYLEEHGTLKIYYNGSVEYKENENARTDSSHGLHLSRFLGFDSSYYTLYEKIRAAGMFIDSLPQVQAATDTSFCLTKIETDGKNSVKLFYTAYYKGIRVILEGSRYAITVNQSGNSIKEVYINTPVINMIRPVKNIRDITVLERLNSETEGQYTIIGAEPVYDIVRDNTIHFTAEWMVE